MNHGNNENIIHIVKPQLSRWKLLQISGIYSIGLFLRSCGTPALEDLVGKL